MALFKYPKSDSKYLWTSHVGRKMYFYGLSADRVKRVLRNPKRSEKGIAPKTIAVMQSRKVVSRSRGKPAVRNEEIWVMYAYDKKAKNNLKQSRKIIITAWRYPGISPIRERVPIPNDILEELRNEKLI